MNTNEMTDNENTPDRKPLTRSQMSLLRVMKQRQEAKAKTEERTEKQLEAEEKPQYLTEAHQKNSEAVMKEIAESNKSPTDWEQESKRQKWNSQDHSIDTN